MNFFKNFPKLQTDLFMKPCITFILIFLANLSFSQLPYDLVPRELFFKEKDKTNIHLSKDGQTVLYLKKEKDAENKIYYINTNTITAERTKEFDGTVLDFTPTYDDGIVAVVQKDTNLQVLYTTVKSRKIKTLNVKPFKRLRFMQLSERFPNKILINLTAKRKKSKRYLFIGFIE